MFFYIFTFFVSVQTLFTFPELLAGLSDFSGFFLQTISHNVKKRVVSLNFKFGHYSTSKSIIICSILIGLNPTSLVWLAKLISTYFFSLINVKH